MTDRNPYSPDAPIPARLRPAMEALGRVGRDLARRIARGPLDGRLDRTVGGNADGDAQKALDVLADRDWDPRAAGEWLGCTASQLVRLIRRCRSAFDLLNRQRQQAGRHPLK